MKVNDGIKQLGFQLLSFIVVGWFTATVVRLLSAHSAFIKEAFAGFYVGWVLGFIITALYWIFSHVIRNPRYPNDKDYTVIVLDYMYTKRLDYKKHAIVLVCIVLIPGILNFF